MGRGRLNLQLLQSQKARRKAYETRKRGLEKKANELSTLCGVDVCLIMYPPPLKNEEIEPYVWSNKPDQVENLIEESHKLPRLGDGYFSRSKTYNLSSFYKDQTRKVQEEIEKVKKTIREVKYPNWDQQYDSFSGEELRMFARVLTAKVESTKETIELFKERKDQVPESSFLMNIPRIDENPDSSLGRKLEQNQFPTYFDAQSYLMINLFEERKDEVPESSFLMNNIPRIDENPDSSLGRKLEQHQFPTYFDAQSYLMINLFEERKDEVPESSFLMNIPRIHDENPDSSLGRKLEQHQFPTYFDAQSYLENQRRTMMINNGASFSGNNPYDDNVMNFAPPMSYDMQNVGNFVPGYGQELMISPGCFPQLYSGFPPSLGSF